MKSKEEIEQLAEKEYPLKVVSIMEGYEDANRFERIAFTKAYTQCQENMADKKYTEKELRDKLESSICATIVNIGHSVFDLSNPTNRYKYIDEVVKSLNKQE